MTPRQSQIAALMTEGLQDKQIARELGLALNTVKFHLRGLFAALGVRNRTQVAVWLYRQRIAELEAENAVLRETAGIIEKLAA